MKDRQEKKNRFKRLFTRIAICAGTAAAVSFAAPAMAQEQTEVLTIKASEVCPSDIPATEVSASETASKTASKTGWVTYKNGRKRYYKNGKYLTGRHKIHGKYYYFASKTGYMKKSSWKTINGKKYYFGWKGAGCTGLTKINGKWYLFSKYGVLRTTKTTVDGITYYMDENGYVDGYLRDGKYYTPSGKEMDSGTAANYETLQYARAIVAQITTSDMSKSQKLLTCFNWVIKHYYSTPRRYLRQENWQTLYANDYLKGGMYGDCFSDACSFAFLAKALGYQDVKICVDTAEIGKGHCFAQVDGLFYDPLFAEAKSFSGNYAAPAGVYSLSPIYTVTI